MNFHDRPRLTRKFFMGLPDGSYLASNNYKLCPDPIPVFSGYVAETGEARNFQWEMLKSLGAAQRSCDVFGSEEEFLKELAYRRGHGWGHASDGCANVDINLSDKDCNCID